MLKKINRILKILLLTLLNLFLGSEWGLQSLVGRILLGPLVLLRAGWSTHAKI